MSAPAEHPDGRAPSSRRTPLFWFTTEVLLRPLFALYLPARIRGREHLPAGGCLLAANHQSSLDIPLLAVAARPRHVTFVARDTLMRNRFVSMYIRHCGAIVVRRGASDRAALRSMAEQLEAGALVAIFPEGTRTSDGSIAAFRRGALMAARLAGAPIVPCGIRGSFEALPRGSAFPRPQRIEVGFGAPLPAPDAADERALLAELRRRVAELSGQPLASDERPAVPPRDRTEPFPQP